MRPRLCPILKDRVCSGGRQRCIHRAIVVAGGLGLQRTLTGLLDDSCRDSLFMEVFLRVQCCLLCLYNAPAPTSFYDTGGRRGAAGVLHSESLHLILRVTAVVQAISPQPLNHLPLKLVWCVILCVLQNTFNWKVTAFKLTSPAVAYFDHVVG